MNDDGNHCVQVCMQHLLAHFDMVIPTVARLDEITEHIPGRYTWLSAGLLWLASKGFRIVHVENIDYKRFAKEGRDYLKFVYPANVFKVQDEMSNLDREQELAKKLVESKAIRIFYGRWSLENVKAQLGPDCVALVSINPCVLLGEEGYASHLVILWEIGTGNSGDDSSVKFLDPDKGEMVVSANLFGKAMDKEDFSVTFITK